MTDKNTTIVIDRINAAVENVTEWIINNEDNDDKFTLLHAVSNMSSAVESLEAQQQAITDSVVGFQYDWSRLNNLIEAELQVQLWNDIVGSSTDTQDLSDMTVTVEVLRAVAKDRAKRLLNDWDRGSSSDSMSNSIDSIKRAINARFVQYFSGDTLTVAEAK